MRKYITELRGVALTVIHIHVFKAIFPAYGSYYVECLHFYLNLRQRDIFTFKHPGFWQKMVLVYAHFVFKNGPIANTLCSLNLNTSSLVLLLS